MHINIACDLGYRPMVIHDKGNRFCFTLFGKATECRTHSFFSRLIRAANPCVHQTGNGPDTRRPTQVGLTTRLRSIRYSGLRTLPPSATPSRGGKVLNPEYRMLRSEEHTSEIQ